MSHQPYETWLLDQAELTAEQAAELQAHLENCPGCAQLQTAWQGVRILIQEDAPLPAPAGFTQRWKESLNLRKARQRARQIRRALFLLGGGTVLVSLGLLIYMAVTTTPAEFFLEVIRFITGTAGTLADIQHFFQFFLRAVPPVVPIILGLALVSWILILGLAWIAAFLRFSIKGEGNQ